MLATTAWRCRRCQAQLALARSFATEATSASTPNVPPLPLTKHPSSSRPRARLSPSPRQPQANAVQAIPMLPPNFGQNQLLSVPNSTRALLESVVDKFNAPIRYAFAYGSGVFEQDGYTAQVEAGKKPMLDFMFAVRHPGHWHSINMAQYPTHYPVHARMLGSDFVSRVQQIQPGLWFNAFVRVNGVDIKYGVTSVDNLCADLLTWQTLYLAGRMHKPLRIIKDDARVRLTQQVNLTSALRTAFLILPENFGETELYERIARISYDGDPRMVFPTENRAKVSNIVRRQSPQFRELYHRLAVGLPGIHWPNDAANIQQDTSPHARAALLKKLPSTLLARVTSRYTRPGFASKEADESAFWIKVAGDENLPTILQSEMAKIVRYPAAVQSVKGLASAGIGKSIRYTSEKIGKWWNSRNVKHID